MKRLRWPALVGLFALGLIVLNLYAANPNTPGTCLWYGPDGGTMTLVNSTNPLPVTAPNSLQVNGIASEGAVASGNPALWTPTTGKKFRLQRFVITVPSNCTLAARGVEVISFQDATTATNINIDVWLDQTAPVETASSQIPNFTTGWVDLGNGYLSSAANNVLNVNLGTALASGNVRVTVCGNEE